MAKYPDWMPNKKPYTAPPDPVVEEIPAEEPIPQRTVYCNVVRYCSCPPVCSEPVRSIYR